MKHTSPVSASRTNRSQGGGGGRVEGGGAGGGEAVSNAFYHRDGTSGNPTSTPRTSRDVVEEIPGVEGKTILSFPFIL